MEPDVDRDSSLLSAILNAAGGMIVVLDSEGRIVRFSRACEEATGYSFDEVRGKFVWDSLLVPDEVDTSKQAIRSLQTDQTANQFESYCLTKNGQKRLFAWSGVRLPEDPSVLWVIGIGIDSTGRRKAEVALRQGQAQLANIIDSATDAIITIDRDQNIVLFNAAAEKMFQCSTESAVGEPIERFIPERFRTAHRNHVDKFDRTNVTKRSMGELGFIWGVRQDGEEFPIEASISQTDVDGQKFYTVIIRDITARKRAEEQLLEQAALLDRASDAIIVRDFENRILYWNRGAERIYGWTAAEASGKNIRELYYKEITPDFEEARQNLLEEGEWAGHAQHLTKAGRHIDVETRWTLVRDDDGNPKSMLVINTDITERKKLEAQFLRAQRMESIGTLAGGIAHDINNIL